MLRANEYRQVLPVTGDEIMDFFSSESFLDAVDETANYTYQRGHESGFLAERGIHDNRIKITEMQFGCSNSLEGGITKPIYVAREYPEQGSRTRGHFCFLELHFHPQCRGPPLPSETDLLSADAPPLVFAQVLKWDVRPIEGVGIVDRDRQVEILLYQKSFGAEIYRQDTEELAEQIQSAVFADDVVTILRESERYKADFMRYSRRGAGYVPCKSDLRRLDAFAYTPTVRIESWGYEPAGYGGLYVDE